MEVTMPLKTIVPAFFILFSGATAIQAMDADDSQTDIRLEAILLPESYDFDATANGSLGSANANGSDDFDSPFRIGVAAVSHRRGDENGPIGMIFGGAVYYSRLPTDDSNTSERYEALSAQLRFGLGLYLGDFFHVEATPFAGIGGARGTINDAESDVELYWEYGFSAGAFVSFGGSLQLGLIGGWLHGEYDLDFNDNDNFTGVIDSANAQLEHEGFFIGASIGARL